MQPARHVRVLILGSGFGGLGAAIRLTQAGQRDFRVLERGKDVGGTWRDNAYPGATCDVPSHLYSFSFELNPRWTRSFSPQREIQDYLRFVARKYHVLDSIVFDCRVEGAYWDAAASRWVVDSTQGRFTADVLVSAVGALAEPALPDIAGIDTFAGPVYHSAQWPVGAGLGGQRVALIGTGASAVQIGPALVDQVAHLDVYQRTPPWVTPRRDRAYGPVEAAVYRTVPGAQRVARSAIYWGREALVLGFTGHRRMQRLPKAVAQRHLRDQVPDEALRARLTPDYTIGCKRILVSDDWYPTLQRPNVDLVTDPIERITADGVVTRGGAVHPADVLVVATGFHVTDSPTFDLIKGADGRSLGETWRQHGQQAYKGSTVAGFPNLFLVVGPNTGLGHTSMVFMIESQLNYLVDALATMDRHDLATVEVRPDALDSYNAAVQERMARTVWTTGGCHSWYLDEHGRNPTLWPGFTFRFRQLTRHFDLAAYDSTARSDRGA